MGEETRKLMLEVGNECTRLGDAKYGVPTNRTIEILVDKLDTLAGRLENEYDLT